MFGLEKLFGKEIEDVALSKDRIAEMLKVSPEALASFEQAYAKAAIDEDEQGGLFCTNSRQAAAKNKKLTGNEPEAVSKLVERIVVELAAQTPVYVYDGKQGTIVNPTALPKSTSFVSNTDISQVPTELRPQLSGNLMQVDIAGLSSESLMFYWDMFQKAKDPKKKKFAYDHFRQGLDILDLDALTYAIIGTNRNSMGTGCRRWWRPAEGLLSSAFQRPLSHESQCRYCSSRALSITNWHLRPSKSLTTGHIGSSASTTQRTTS